MSWVLRALVPGIVGVMVLGGCDRSGEVPPPAADTTGRDATGPLPGGPLPGGSLVDQAGPTPPGKDGISTTRTSPMSSLPSLTGTDTTNMPTADAAAQRLIDAARLSLKENPGKAKTHLGNLRQMSEQLTPGMKAKVDELAREIEGGAATRP